MRTSCLAIMFLCNVQGLAHIIVLFVSKGGMKKRKVCQQVRSQVGVRREQSSNVKLAINTCVLKDVLQNFIDCSFSLGGNSQIFNIFVEVEFLTMEKRGKIVTNLLIVLQIRRI